MNLEHFVLSHEPAIRLAFFLGIFILVGVWEYLPPRRALSISKPLRWANNLALVGVNTVVLRLAFPLAGAGIAAFAAAHGWGLLNHFLLPAWIAVPLAVIAMDFAIWLQHVMMLAVPAFWRLQIASPDVV